MCFKCVWGHIAATRQLATRGKPIGQEIAHPVAKAQARPEARCGNTVALLMQGLRHLPPFR
eukprot:57056-Prorocentrum_lima.AAC.1